MTPKFALIIICNRCLSIETKIIFLVDKGLFIVRCIHCGNEDTPEVLTEELEDEEEITDDPILIRLHAKNKTKN